MPEWKEFASTSSPSMEQRGEEDQDEATAMLPAGAEEGAKDLPPPSIGTWEKELLTLREELIHGSSKGAYFQPKVNHHHHC